MRKKTQYDGTFPIIIGFVKVRPSIPQDEAVHVLCAVVRYLGIVPEPGRPLSVAAMAARGSWLRSPGPWHAWVQSWSVLPDLALAYCNFGPSSLAHFDPT